MLLTGYLILLLGMAAVFDWRTGKIPNGICAGGLVAGFACGGSVAGSFLGIAFALYVGLSEKRFSGGDVKLMAGLGAIVGSNQLLVAYLCAMLFLYVYNCPRIRRPFAPWLLLGFLPVIVWRIGTEC